MAHCKCRSFTSLTSQHKPHVAMLAKT